MNAVTAIRSVEDEIELTILMPCLNEAETLATCIEKAQALPAPARHLAAKS